MDDTGGPRERKKRRMCRRLPDTAIGLFVARGFESVPVAEVAGAAEVSSPGDRWDRGRR
ncbi:hypothetical protein [Streptomyces sp. URMC 125]|uniref:hypothetical protein n=1 Tax=Streptomyces sp. URMC 125 TaxID=3423419 RepID=UPI003F1BE902